ncbi:MAG: hypothetical protein WAO76_18175 [Georgfuchsia sp.]
MATNLLFHHFLYAKCGYFALFYTCQQLILWQLVFSAGEIRVTVQARIPSRKAKPILNGSAWLKALAFCLSRGHSNVWRSQDYPRKTGCHAVDYFIRQGFAYLR